jgi:hypothetical protein
MVQKEIRMKEKYTGMGGDPNTYSHPVIAFIIDGEVVSILNTDERMAAVLLSNPIIVDITEEKKVNPYIVEGWVYKDGEFILPMEEE